jgi:hypothetical protein
LEEEGIIHEVEGLYSVHKKFLPIAIHDLVSGSIMIEVEPQEVFQRDSPQMIVEDHLIAGDEDVINDML